MEFVLVIYRYRVVAFSIMAFFIITGLAQGQSDNNATINTAEARRKQLEEFSNEELFARYVAGVRQHANSIDPSLVNVRDLCERGAEIFLPMFPPLFHDPSIWVMREAYGNYAAFSANSSNLEIRVSAVETLAASMLDWLGNKEDAGRRREALAVIRDGMRLFTLSRDFSGSARNSMEQALALLLQERDSTGTLNFLIGACGVAGMESVKPHLAQAIELDKQIRGETEPARLLSCETWKGSLTWAAMRASARIYESPDIHACIATVMRNSSTPEQLLDNAGELVYIRRPEIAEFLLPFTQDITPYQETKGDVLVPYPTRADHAVALLLSMMPDVRAEALAEQERRAAAEGVMALSYEAAVTISLSYATDKNNWKRIER